MRIRRLLLAASLILAGPAFGQLPRPGVMIPASKVSISGYTNTDLQSGLSEGEITSSRAAADCTAENGGKPNEICRDTDDQTLWICTSATECNAASWTAHGGGGGGGSGDVTAVGPGCSTGACFTDGLATTGTTMFIWEGTSVDSNELSILSPSANPGADIAITLPSATGTLMTTADTAGGASKLDSGQSSPTATAYDVKFGTTTTQWYTDLDGDDAVDTGEQIRLATRKQVIATTLTGAGINTAVTACGGVPCDIHLLAGTYTEVCLNLTTSTNDIHFSGQGKGITILKPDADLDDCVATTSGQTIGLNGADDIEMDNFTLDGDKELYGPPSCLAGGLANCGTGIWLNSPSVAIASRFHLHDVEIKDIIATGVSIEHGDSAIIERVTITNIGCNQSDTICGNGAGHSGWDAISDYGPANSKSKATGITMNGIYATSATIQDNIINRTTYTGIESYVGAKGARIIHNDITLTPGGITVNGGIHTYIAENYSHANAQHAGTGQAGTGVLIIGDADYVTLTDNKITANDSSGLVVSASGTDGKGHIIIDNNEITGNCVDHNAGGNVFINGGSVVYDLLFRNNVVTGSSTCPYALDSNWNSVGSLGYNGSVIFEGGLYDAGTTGAVKLWNPNMWVHGLNITGALLFRAEATGIAFGNTASDGITYAAGSKMTVVDNGVMNLSGGTSSGQLQIMEPSASGSNKATFTAPALAADTVYVLPTTDGNASEFLQTNGTGTLTWAAPAGSGTITGVGPAFTTGLAFTDGTASSGTTMLVWEGTSVDTNELSILSPSANPGADINITLPSTTGTLVGSGDTGTVTSVMVLDGDLGYGDFDHSQTLASNPAFLADSVNFGTTGLIFEGPTANLIEGLLTAGAITTTDKTWTLPDATGTIIVSATALAGAVTGTPSSANFLRGDGTWSAPAGSGDVVAASDSQPWGSGSAATVVHTFQVSGVDDVVTYGNGTTGFNGSLTAQGSFSFDTLDPILYWDDGSFADGTIETLTRGWAVSDDNGAFAVEVESGTPGSYYTPLIVHSSSGTTSLYLGGDGAEQAAPTNAIKVSEAGAMTAIGTGTINGANAGTDVIATGQLLVGNGTGTGTYESNVAIAGTMTATSFTASPSATPTVALRDSDNADSEDNVRLFANCVVTTSGAEDCTATLDQYVDGVVKNAFSSIGDGAGTIGSDQNTSWTITSDGGSVVVDGSITATSAAPQIVLGVNTSVLGSIKLFGSTSGDATIKPNVVAGTATSLTLPAATGTLPVIIAQGTVALDTDAIASTACDTSDTAISATGTLSTDVLSWSFNADITAITGYAPATTGALIIYAYPSADAVNFKVCNPTALSITPGSAVTLNWKVIR